mmetsp:Transcript_2705/g.6181  ORF Transcript_2705/g.6181 Transcript_2705/m.6181 type:complete len:240 (+) Transcript_2705:948-1667(+)
MEQRVGGGARGAGRGRPDREGHCGDTDPHPQRRLHVGVGYAPADTGADVCPAQRHAQAAKVRCAEGAEDVSGAPHRSRIQIGRGGGDAHVVPRGVGQVPWQGQGGAAPPAVPIPGGNISAGRLSLRPNSTDATRTRWRSHPEARLCRPAGCRGAGGTIESDGNIRNFGRPRPDISLSQQRRPCPGASPVAAAARRRCLPNHDGDSGNPLPQRRRSEPGLDDCRQSRRVVIGYVPVYIRR